MLSSLKQKREKMKRSPVFFVLVLLLLFRTNKTKKGQKDLIPRMTYVYLRMEWSSNHFWKKGAAGLFFNEIELKSKIDKGREYGKGKGIWKREGNMEKGS